MVGKKLDGDWQKRKAKSAGGECATPPFPLCSNVPHTLQRTGGASTGSRVSPWPAAVLEFHPPGEDHTLPPSHAQLSSLHQRAHSGLAHREKERVLLYRQKTKAALVIQLAWRR